MTDKTNNDWPTATPTEAGLDGDVLAGLTSQFEAWEEANLHAALIVRHGKLAYEHYFAGQDERWGRPLGRVTHDAGKPHDLRSVTKSVISLLAGCVLGQESEAALATPVFDLFPEHADLATGGKETMTLGHLLEMSTGLVWDEDLPYSDPANSERMMTVAPDRVRYVLEQPLWQRPGAAWTYNGGATALIAEALTRRTGKTLDALAQEHLFGPLGIEAEWIRYDDGVAVAASGLRLRPRDTARIGQMVLQGGRWQEDQVVPADWIALSTAPRLNGPGLFFFGLQWWLGRSLVAHEEIRWIAGVGWGGQRLFIVPARDLVVVVHAGLYDNPAMQPIPAEIVLRRYALAACL